MNKESCYRSMLIFPLIDQHAHGSTVVEAENGDILSAWFQGSGERWADDVCIMGARLRNGENQWSDPFLMADVPEFPDINPAMFIDPQKRLWLVWYTVIANQWDTSILKYRISENYMISDGAPEWCWQEVLHVKPGDRAERGIQPNDRFVKSVEKQIDGYTEYLKSIGTDEESMKKWYEWSARMIFHAKGKDMMRKGQLYDENGGYADQDTGYAYFQRMGWQTKNKAVIVNGNRIILPLYSDGFEFSLMAITDNFGKTWQFSEPLVGSANIQPSIAIKSDGTLVAYMRDNGFPPKRLYISISKDNGMTWNQVRKSDLPNPGSGADIVTLKNGHWVLAYNDTEKGRHSLAVSISTDEGQSWKYTRHLELDESGEKLTGAYPAIIEGYDGILHVTYTYTDRSAGEAIKYVQFNEAWIMEA